MNAERAFPELPDLSKIEEDEHFDAICSHQDAISEMLGLSCVWSVGDHDLRDVAFQGTWRVRYVEGHHWGQGTLTSKSMMNPTWIDLWQAADAVIGASGDAHHIFVESFDIDGEGFLRLGTGS